MPCCASCSSVLLSWISRGADQRVALPQPYGDVQPPSDLCCSLLDLGNLAERQLDRRLATEDRHQYLELLAVRVDLADRRGQRGERAVHHGHRLAHLEVDL